MMKMKHTLLAACAALALFSHVGMAKEVKIGMAIDDLRLERWHRDLFLRPWHAADRRPGV